MTEIDSPERVTTGAGTWIGEKGGVTTRSATPTPFAGWEISGRRTSAEDTPAPSHAAAAHAAPTPTPDAASVSRLSGRPR